MKRNTKFPILSVMICIISIISGCAANFSKTPVDYSVMNGIAATLQVTPSWHSIREYLFNAAKPGMTRDEIHKILDKIGPWTIDLVDTPGEGLPPADGLYRENIHFTEKNTFEGIGYWGFLYDKNGILDHQGPAD